MACMYSAESSGSRRLVPCHYKSLWVQKPGANTRVQEEAATTHTSRFWSCSPGETVSEGEPAGTVKQIH
jgi:hypothetical protein